MVHRKIRLKSAVSLVLAAFIVFLISSCATVGQKVYHGILMKGSIIEASGSEVYLCIGSKDGTSVGQELDIYKIIKTKSKVTPFKRAHTGKVKITEIVDEHFAKATVISGKAEENDIVELISP